MISRMAITFLIKINQNVIIVEEQSWVIVYATFLKITVLSGFL